MLEHQILQTEKFLELPDKETGAPPESRIKNADAVRSIYRRLVKDDEDRSYNRSLVRRNLDGTPPFDTAKRAEDGQEELFNVNTGEGRLIVDEATSGVMDIFDPGKMLTNIPLSKTLPEQSRSMWENKINYRWSQMLRKWDGFIPRMTNLCFTFCADGVATLFFEDDMSWKVNSASLAEVKFPEYCEPVSTSIPIACIKKDIHVGTLYKWVRDEAMAEKHGWNRKAVFKAIHESAKQHDRSYWSNWEKLEEDLKANELYVSSVANPIPIIFTWVQEFDGSVSTFICAETGGEFLKSSIGNYANANQAYQIFPYSTGTNNRLYTIRGIGYFVYQPSNAKNIMWSTMMNAAAFSALNTYQVRDGAERDDAFLQDFAVGTLLGPGVSIAENSNSKNLAQTLVPALSIIDDTLADLSGGLSEGPQAFGERANESSINYALESMNKMNSFAIQLFYPPLDRAYAEMVRRVFKENKDTEESREMKRLLREEDGIDEKIWKKILWDQVEAVRIIGGGSKAKRINNLMQVRREAYADFDAQGRKANTFDLVSEKMGPQYAERYMGELDRTREPIDSRIAELENLHLSEGAEIEPKDGEDHYVHIQEHIEYMVSGNQAVEQNMLDVADFALQNIKVWEHAKMHEGMWVVPKQLEVPAAELRAALQRIGEHIGNGMRKAQKEAQDAQPSPEDGAGGVAEDEGRVLEEQRKQASWEREEARKDMSTQAEIQRKDAKTAADIAAKSATQTVSM